MTTYDELQELHEAFAARAEVEAVLEEARLRLRLAAQATGMGPSELAREPGFKSPTSAADLLDAAKNHHYPVRRKGPSPEQQAERDAKAAAVAEKKAAKARATKAGRRGLKPALVLNLVTGAESVDTPQVEPIALYPSLEDIDLLDLEPRTARAS